MTDELILHSNPQSRGRIARWMLEETGASYRIVYHDYGAPMRTPEFLALNPMGKVPVLQHGAKIVTECAAICAYLADIFPDAGLAPPPNDRADYYRWLFFASGPMEAAVVNRALGLEHPEERRQMSQYGSYAAVMDTLESALDGRQYIVGDHFSAADVFIGAHLGWGLHFGSIDTRPAFQSYVDKLAKRDAYKRANALDDEAAAAAKAPVR